MTTEDAPERKQHGDNSLAEFIGGARFATYLGASRDDPRLAEQVYVWNMRASGGLLELFSILEVALRNSIVDRLQSMSPTDVTWFDYFADVLSVQASKQIEQAIIRSTSGRGDVDQHRVTAELSFGFWTSLLASGYEMTLWRAGLNQAFPHAAASSRIKIYKSLRRLRDLRNRVAHHEPIFYRDLSREAAEVHRVIGWISPVAANWSVRVSRVEAIVAVRPGLISSQERA